MRGVGAVRALGQTETYARLAGELTGNQRLFLILASIGVEHDDDRKIADDRMLVLQVVVQAEALGGKVFADRRHGEIGAVLAAIRLRQREAKVAGLVGDILRLAQQRFPFLARQAAIVEIRARPFAAMIEEADVVVAILDRLDLAFDEGVEFDEIVADVFGQSEIHGRFLLLLACGFMPVRAILRLVDGELRQRRRPEMIGKARRLQRQIAIGDLA